MTIGRRVAIVWLGLALALSACTAGSSGPPAGQASPSSVPKGLFQDRLDAVATGRPSVPDRPSDIVHVQRYALVASLPTTPNLGTVYALDPALAPSPQAVASVWGLTAPPQYSDGQVTIGAMMYFPQAGAIEFNRPSNPQAVRVDPPGHLARPPADQASAIGMAGDFLVAHGLFSRDEVATMTTSAQRLVYSTTLPFWVIQLGRTLGGVADYGFWQPGATLQVADDGRIDSVIVVRRTVAGREQSSLIDPSQAWRQVVLGHWYAADGVINNGSLAVPSFSADKVELCYREDEVDTAQKWLVPMWCFADVTTTPGITLRLYYPALPAGTFDWAVPNRN